MICAQVNSANPQLIPTQGEAYNLSCSVRLEDFGLASPFPGFARLNLEPSLYNELSLAYREG
jgi:hypothetical protein